MRSPGAPPTRRDVVRELWGRIAEGVEYRGGLGGVWRVGGGGVSAIPSGWRHAKCCLGATSGRYLSFAEHEEIALARERGEGVRDIAAMPGRSSSTIAQELDRNSATPTGRMVYWASVAQWKAELRSRRRRPRNW